MYFFFQTIWLGTWLRNLFWKMVKGDIVKELELPESLMPKKNVVEDFHFQGVENPAFLPLVKKGKIDVKYGRATGLVPGKKKSLVVKKNASDVQPGNESSFLVQGVDIVVLTSGFESSVPKFLSKEMQRDLFNKYGQIQLFRSIYNPTLGPSIAFIGFQLSSNTILSCSLAARWILELFKGTNTMLNKTLQDEEMVQGCIQAGLDWDRALYRDPNKAMGHIAGQMSPIMYYDAILGDLGSTNFYRSDKGLVDSFTGKVLPRHYAGFMTEKL